MKGEKRLNRWKRPNRNVKSFDNDLILIIQWLFLIQNLNNLQKFISKIAVWSLGHMNGVEKGLHHIIGVSPKISP